MNKKKKIVAVLFWIRFVYIKKQNKNAIKKIHPSFYAWNMFCKTGSVKMYCCRSAAIGWFIQCEKRWFLNHFVPLPQSLSIGPPILLPKTPFNFWAFYLTSFRISDAEPNNALKRFLSFRGLFCCKKKFIFYNTVSKTHFVWISLHLVAKKQLVKF